MAEATVKFDLCKKAGPLGTGFFLYVLNSSCSVSSSFSSLFSTHSIGDCSLPLGGTGGAPPIPIPKEAKRIRKTIPVVLKIFFKRIVQKLAAPETGSRCLYKK
jgi:hypothetical protein